uniref:Polypyrimidine tract-binding protein homolog 1 isoform X2 n=1 Tax=Rhizophora mucronata TaxID=61149 RepID=A0A2P2LWE1_RHIMU
MKSCNLFILQSFHTSFTAQTPYLLAFLLGNVDRFLDCYWCFIFILLCYPFFEWLINLA